MLIDECTIRQAWGSTCKSLPAWGTPAFVPLHQTAPGDPVISHSLSPAFPRSSPAGWAAVNADSCQHRAMLHTLLAHAGAPPFPRGFLSSLSLLLCTLLKTKLRRWVHLCPHVGCRAVQFQPHVVAVPVGCGHLGADVPALSPIAPRGSSRKHSPSCFSSLLTQLHSFAYSEMPTGEPASTVEIQSQQPREVS